MKKSMSILVVCMTLLLICSILMVNISTVNAEPSLTFTDHSAYVDSYGWLHVVGEVENNGTEPLQFVEILASFYNESYEFVGSDWTFTFRTIIDVEEISPFEIIFTEETQVPKVYYYELDFNFDIATDLNPEADLTILYYDDYIDSIDVLHIIGEVQNNGSVPLDWITVIATFYNSTDEIVGVDWTFTDLDIIDVGETSPFDIHFGEETQIPKVDHYSLTIDFEEGTALTPALIMLSNSSYVDSSGWMHIIGEIENNGTETATFVQIVASLYDSEGNIVLDGYAYTDPSDVSSGEKAPFEITIYDDDRVPLVETYSLSVQSNEYNLIPEFSALFFMSIIVSMLAIAGLAPVLTGRKKTKSKV